MKGMPGTCGGGIPKGVESRDRYARNFLGRHTKGRESHEKYAKNGLRNPILQLFSIIGCESIIMSIRIAIFVEKK